MSVEWRDFFIAGAGAAGSLVGLLIVAISVNLTPILKTPGVSARAAATIATVAVSLATSIGALVPGQALWVLGTETMLSAGAALTLHVRALSLGVKAHGGGTSVLTMRILEGPTPVLPFLIGGIFLLANSSTGLYLIVAGTIAALLAAIENTWVLLVEILR